MKNDLIIQSV